MSFNANDHIDLSDEQEHHVVLLNIDSMIESTEEFIADDGLRADDQRVHDLSALLRVRHLYAEVFTPLDVTAEELDAPVCRHCNQTHEYVPADLCAPARADFDHATATIADLLNIRDEEEGRS